MAGDVPEAAAAETGRSGAAPTALYRRYRPATFAELKGQDHVTEPLRQALRSGRVHHAYLFSGPRGCGKTSSARILARSLNCEQGPTPDPCGKCASCVALAPSGPGSISENITCRASSLLVRRSIVARLFVSEMLVKST